MSYTHEQVEEIFNRACDLPPEQRRAYLAEVRAGSEELFHDVESLLRELDSDVTGVVAGAVSDVVLDAAEHERLPDRLGEFRIVRLLGEGGMGRVFEAVQESPSRSVALKVIRAGAFSRSLLSRFRREANVLAQLKHPGIAQVLQVGSFTLADGQTQPYFAMELVHGLPITEHVRSHGMGARARLALIAKICDAVQHAHQRGVIHRDLKPANVLVEDAATDPGGDGTSFEKVGQPKVLDFGIARLVKEEPDTAAALSMRTEVGQIIGTLAYMSPEQASGDSSVIDTRADVYALGVLAYEILTGRVPVDVAGKPITLAVKLIHEEAPARLGSLVPALRGDAEVVIAKALDKDPDQRYSSAGELGADIRRFLRNEPIVARPASMMYTVRKFSRRHRATLTGVAAAVVGVIGSLAYGLVQTRDQRDRAVRAEAETATRADQLQKVSDFQAKMLAQVDPAVAGQLLTANVKAMFEATLLDAGEGDAARDADARAFAAQWSKVNATDAARKLIDSTILTPAVDAIDKQFADQPVVAAALQLVIGGRYSDLGMNHRSVDLLAAAAETRRRELGAEHRDTLLACRALGNALSLAGKSDESERILLDTLTTSRRVLGPEHEETLYTMNSLAVTSIRQGRFADAEKLTREALQTARRVLGENHEQLPAIIGNLAGALEEQGKFAEAEPYHRETLDKVRQAHGEDHPLTLQASFNFSNHLLRAGRLADAEPYVRDVLEQRRRVLGEDHPDTLSSLEQHGIMLKAQGASVEAERVFRDVLAARRRTMGNESPATLASLTALVTFLIDTDHADQAEPLAREAMGMHRRILGEDHPRTLTTMSNFALLIINQGQLAEAEQLAGEVLEKRRRSLGADHADTLVSLNIMAFAFEKQQKLEEAETYYREALETCRRTVGTERPDTVIYLNNLGGVLWTMGKLTEAEEMLREASGIAERIHGPRHGTTLVVKLKLGGVLIDLERFKESLGVLAPFEDMARRGGDISQRSAGLVLMRLGVARSSLHEFATAEADLVQAHSLFMATDGASSKYMRGCLKALVDLYAEWSKAEPARHDAQRLKWSTELDALDTSSTQSPPTAP